MHKEALSSEFPWALKVFEIIQTKAGNSKGIRALQIQNFIQNELMSVIDFIDEEVG